ncbi:chaperone protein [Musa troglodytarum]|uniref:Chaperone protein n=1 Tax=Musa troglodytarum TaxID=320322 RepID=A0A9E7ED20_9LILI|nr:chaperone protein [Musa troglodytarum]
MFRDDDYGGQDVKVSLEISFMEAVQGCTKTITFQAPVNCRACGGSRVPPGTRPETCWPCRGSGMIFMQTGPFRLQTTCSRCGGFGQTVKSLCKLCKGQKVVRGTKSVKLDVMAGVDDNETIKVYRSGGGDPDTRQPGDLYVTIKVREDPVFFRDKANIYVDAVLRITQAILGGTIQVPTLTGDVVLKVKPGQKVVLQGKGIKTRSNSFYGDQFVHFSVTIPANLSRRQRNLIEEFAKEERGDDENNEAAAGAS